MSDAEAFPIADRRNDCERWFVRRGLPNVIHKYSVTEDVLTRAAPVLLIIFFIELFFSFGDRWAGWAQAGAFLAGVGIVATAVALANTARGRRPFELPEDVEAAEVGLFLFVPPIIGAIGSGSATWRDALMVFLLNALLLALVTLTTAWGVVSMIRWSLGQFRYQIVGVIDLLVKSLPIMLLFSVFIFLNAEMWQVANDFTLPYFAVVVGLLAVIGAIFVAYGVNQRTPELARFASWAEIRPMCDGTPVQGLVPGDDDAQPDPPAFARREVVNIGLLLFVAQGIQIILVATLIGVFYMVFGLFTVRSDTILQWTTDDSLTPLNDWALRFNLFGDELLITRQLLLVSGFIAALSGLQFAVQVVNDDSYRQQFARDMTGELRQALAVRSVYHRVLVTDE